MNTLKCRLPLIWEGRPSGPPLPPSRTRFSRIGLYSQCFVSKFQSAGCGGRVSPRCDRTVDAGTESKPLNTQLHLESSRETPHQDGKQHRSPMRENILVLFVSTVMAFQLADDEGRSRNLLVRRASVKMGIWRGSMHDRMSADNGGRFNSIRTWSDILTKMRSRMNGVIFKGLVQALDRV